MNARHATFFRLVVLAILAAVPLYTYGVVMIVRYGGLAQEFGWTAARAGDGWRVQSVVRDGAAAGALEVGDVVLAVDGDPRAARLGPFHVLRVDPPGAVYTVRVDRPSGIDEVELPLPVRWEVRRLVPTLTLLAGSLAFFVVGSFIGLIRPGDRMPRLLTTASLPAGLLLLGTALRPSSAFFQGAGVVPYLGLVSIYPWHYVLGFRFFNRFTSNDAPTRFWTFVERALIVWGALVFVPRTIMTVLGRPGWPRALDVAWSHLAWFEGYARLSVPFEGAFAAAVMLAMCLVLAVNYSRIRASDQRRRLRWIVVGTAAGLLPLTLAVIARLVLNASGHGAITGQPAFELVFRVANGLPILIPITFGYAVARHRVLGVGVVVRRGVQYLLATNVLRVVLALPVVALVARVAANPSQTVGDILFGPSSWVYLVLFAAVLASLRFRRQLRDWVDRRFFRETYDRHRILLDLVERVTECASMEAISALVCRRVGDALHPAGVHLVYRDAGGQGFAVGYSSSGAAAIARLDEQPRLLALVGASGEPLELTPGRRNELPDAERVWAEQVGVDLVVPVLAADRRLSGLMLLGARKSEEPYSADDRRLLAAIAGQVSVVAENLALKARADRDRRVRHEVIARLDASLVSLLKECPVCAACYDSAVERCEADGAELELTLPVERTLDGRYRLDRSIGRGGMGAVYEASDTRLGRPVAVKVMLGSLFGDRDALRRFEREAQAAARLAHPNIVAVHDYGRAGAAGAYLVMELVRGRSWRGELERRGTVPPAEAAVWFDQMLSGLGAAHGNGVVHRDLKPENLLLASSASGDPLVKILDFGLAKTRAADPAVTRETATTPGVLLGTFGYMSPEQLSGRSADERADLFAVGVMVAETLTGRRPFAGATFTDLLRSVVQDEFHLSGDGEGVARLDEVLQRCLAKAPEERYRSAQALRDDLVPALAACPPLVAGGAARPAADATTLRGDSGTA